MKCYLEILGTKMDSLCDADIVSIGVL